MARPQFKNWSIVTVSIGYNAAATSIVLTAGHGASLPSTTPYWLVWWDSTTYSDPASDPNKEIVLVTARSSDTLTVTRGQDGTSASTKNTASKTYKMQLTDNAGLFDDIYHTHRFPTCGRFAYSSATACLFSPKNGNKVMIDGKVEVIPDAGVSFGNGGLSANTLYYAYVWMNSGTMTGEFSTTGHSVATGTGCEIKTGDSTRTLVGMVRTNASSEFVDSLTQRLVLSWFNQRDVCMSKLMHTSNVTTTSTSNVELNGSSSRGEFLCWAGEQLWGKVSGGVSHDTINGFCLLYLYIDGVQVDGAAGRHQVYTGTGSGHICGTGPVAGLAEGYHYASPFGSVTAGTGTFTGAAGGTTTYVAVTTRG